MRLVRDKIPELMLNEGKTVEIRTAMGREYEFMLMKKLQEEVDEYLHDRTAEELADIEEVLHCLADIRGFDWEKIEELRNRKNNERESFKKKIILEKVELCEQRQ
ncbi:MAG: nucleoside triphosphate pyrophosphohydrolase [Candidatus Aenigmatarchaeota archaeon]